MKHFFLFLFLSVTSFAQQINKVDFIKCNAFLTPNVAEKSISGKIIYEFKIKKETDTIKIDAVNMNFSNVSVNGKNVRFKNSGKNLVLFEGFKIGKNILTFDYSAKPKQTLYFIGEGDDLQIWTQGQGKYTSHWLPSFDDVNEKVIFNISVAFNPKFQVLANGKFQKSILLELHKVWYYEMQKPMSSYLVMLAIGKFKKQSEFTKTGTVLEYYLSDNDSLKFEPTYRYSKQMFSFLEKEIGVKYPWKVYRQVPVRDFLYAGMENTTATIFSQDFVVDEIGFNDKNYVNVNAHELAHQWFGDFITAKESKHHWLQEGFATYYALLAEKEIFGDDYFNYELYQMAKQLKEMSKNDTIPILNAKASSLTFYKKGAWALHFLRTNIGEKKFKKAVKCYLKKYAYKNVNTDDFLAIIKKVSKYDVELFKKQWLEESYFQWDEVIKILNRNKFVVDLQEVEKLEPIPFKEKKFQLYNYLNAENYYPIAQEVLLQTKLISFEEKKEIIDIAFKSNNLKVRQALAQSFTKIPVDYQIQYESLLNDKSYITKEIVLFRLWTNFKEDKIKYANLLKEEIGLNYNLKIAGLILQTISYPEDNNIRQEAIKELEKMTKSPYESSVRENALKTLLNFSIHSDTVLISLLEASLHHKWQFVTFAKHELRKLISKDDLRLKYESFLPNLDEVKKDRLEYFLK